MKNLHYIQCLESSETKTGRLVVTLKKAYDKALETTAEIECELVATPEERDSLGDEYVLDTTLDEKSSLYPMFKFPFITSVVLTAANPIISININIIIFLFFQ